MAPAVRLPEVRPAPDRSGEGGAEAVAELRRIMWDRVGLVRDEAGLDKLAALEEQIAELDAELMLMEDERPRLEELLRLAGELASGAVSPGCGLKAIHIPPRFGHGKLPSKQPMTLLLPRQGFMSFRTSPENCFVQRNIKGQNERD